MTRQHTTRTSKFGSFATVFVGTTVVLSLCWGIWYFSIPNEAAAQRSTRNRPVVQKSSATAGTTASGTRAVQAKSPASKAHIRKAAIPDVVATVNRQEISRDHLGKEALRRFGEDVLESMVNKHLILQACKREGIRITQKDVDNEIQNIAAKFKMSAEQWIATLAENRNISLEQYRRDIVWPTLALKQLAADKLVVSDSDMQKAFETEYGPKVQVRMISANKKVDAQRLLTQAQAKPDQFGRLAKDHSEDPNSAAARGLIPPIRRHVGDPLVENAAFALKKGEVSGIIHVANQYLILKCERHIPAAHISPQFRRQAEDRLRDRIVESKLRGAANELFKELQRDAKVVNVFNDSKRRNAMPGVAATINGHPNPIGSANRGVPGATWHNRT